MRKLRLAGITFAACLLASEAVAQADYTIRVAGGSSRNRGFVTHIGSWSMNDSLLREAIQAFGAPSSEQDIRPGIARPSVADCAATWNQIGLQASFTTLGFSRGACDPEKAVWTASVTGKQWRTARGLRVGDPKSRILKLYPNAKWHKRTGWTLVLKYWSFGDPRPKGIPSVSATVSHGRIAAFRLFVNTQGE